MKTAMQELFEKFGHLFPNIETEYLEKEKQQIIDLCTEAYKTGLGYKEYSALDSYNETFKK